MCCLVSKHERSGGGAGSLNIVYVADGTGFANSPAAGNEWDGPRDAALTKGMRFALGDPGWSPRDSRPPPYPAHLKVEIITNNKEVSLYIVPAPRIVLVCVRLKASKICIPDAITTLLESAS